MHQSFIWHLSTAACACGWLLAAPLFAYAESCDNLDTNPEWAKGFEQINLDFKTSDWNHALKVSRQLESICEFSPSLNYTIARIHKNLNDDEKYLFYLQKATQNTERMAVDKNLLDRMWSEKYIVAHPEASPESIQEYQRQIEALKHQTADKSEEMRVYKTVMWTGAGIGIGGLAMAGAGLAISLLTDPAEIRSGIGSEPDQYKENAFHSLGWAFVGIGGALTVTGAVLAGIYGYKYKHYFDSASLSLQLSPNHATLQLNF